MRFDIPDWPEPDAATRRRARLVTAVAVGLLLLGGGGAYLLSRADRAERADSALIGRESAAVADIRGTIARVYSMDAPAPNLIDDSTGVEAAWHEAKRRSPVPFSQIELDVVDVRMLAADRAEFDYTIVAGPTRFEGRHGRARRTAGVWKLERAGVCADLALAGGDC